MHAQIVREKVAVEVITLRVAARERGGVSVDDLTAADLSLKVDGKPVAVDSLTPPSIPASAVEASAGPSNAAPAPGASAPEKRTRTLIFADEGETLAFDRRVVYDELERLLQSDGPGSREVMVGRFAGSHLEVACPWTAEPARAISALRRLRRSPAANGLPTASGVAGTGTPITWIELYQEHLHQALLEAIAAFPDDPADRQLLIVSGGTTLMRPFDLAAVLSCQVTPGERARLARMNADVSRAHAREIERATFALWSRAVNPSGDVLTMTDVVAKAVERDVAVIPVAAEAIDRGVELGFERTLDARDVERNASAVLAAGDGRITPRTGVAQSMMEIAESTGSEPILVPGKTAARLSEIGSRSAYALTFRDPSGDHRYHRVELVSRRKGVTLDYRRGYRIPNEDERMLDAAVARLADSSAGRGANPLNVDATLSGEPGEKAALLAIRMEPPRESSPAGGRAVDLVGVGEDSAGQRTEPVSWSGTARALDDEPGVYALKTRLGVPAGDFRWSLAVRDAETGLTSYVLIPASR